MDKIPIIFDMETSDPDDVITLLFLLQHSRVNLKAITITPGTAFQVGIIKQILSLVNKDIPIGANLVEHYTKVSIDKQKKSVSQWHYDLLGDVSPNTDVETAIMILAKYCDADTTIVTGGPLTNLDSVLQHLDIKIGRLVAQGDFAGEGVVPSERQLDKFKGLVTCPTFNLNGNVQAAYRVLRTKKITIKKFVSKNVCHGVVYNQAMHNVFGLLQGRNPALDLIYKGMSIYLDKNPRGKMLHDPLTACCAIDDSIGTWAEVELFREKGEWGSRLLTGSDTWIITDYNHNRFMEVFTEWNN